MLCPTELQARRLQDALCHVFRGRQTEQQPPHGALYTRWSQSHDTANALQRIEKIRYVMNRSLNLTGIAVVAALLAGCATSKTINQQPFGKTTDGTAVQVYTLRNVKGATARITNYGGILLSLMMPDRDGKLADVVLGYDDLENYLRFNPYFGALVGRYGNRIANGRFTLDGKTYTLATNKDPHHLHGGLKGFDKVVWQARPRRTKQGPALELRYVSNGGEEGYPGTLTVTAVYTLTSDNELRLDFTATTDKPTICNLTNHSYFNLAGKGDILGHEVTIFASRFTPVDSTLIPTGELRPVKDTPFDFTTPHTIGERMGQDNEQLRFGNGYDHNWVIDKPAGQLGLMARVYEPTSGRVLEVFSTEPGLQFYSGNFLHNALPGKGGCVYQNHSGFAMEAEHFPDSPNHPNFPSVVLRPGKIYRNTILYRFSTR